MPTSPYCDRQPHLLFAPNLRASRNTDQPQADGVDFDRPSSIKQQIGRLDVSMHNATTMRVFQTTRRLQDLIGSCGNRKRSFVFDHLRQVFAFHTFDNRRECQSNHVTMPKAANIPEIDSRLNTNNHVRF
jgi:hypothetical protein